MALEEFFPKELGVEYPALVNEHRIGLPTVHLETDFYKPLRYGDVIEIEVGVRTLGRSSIGFGYRVFKQGEAAPRIVGQNVTVCLDMDTFVKKDIPGWLRERLERCRGDAPLMGPP